MCRPRRWRSWSIGATRDARRYHPAVHRVAHGRRPVPTFNVWRSERRFASPADYSVDLRVRTDQPIEANGEEAHDFPIYCQRLSFFPEVPEHEAVAELFLPLK